MIDDLLREARPAVAAPDPVVVLRARRAVLRRALAGRRRRRSLRLVTAVAATVTAVGMVGLIGGERTGATAEAATVLATAADAMDMAAAPAAGQYLYRRNVERYWDFGPSASDPTVEDRSPRAEPLKIETWVPADPSEPMVQRTTDPDRKLPQTERVAWAVVAQSSNDAYPIYRDQPSDAKAMLQALRDVVRRAGDDLDSNDDAVIWGRAFTLLADPQAPDAVRAETLRALALLPSVRVVDATARIGEQTGVAIGTGGKYGVEYVFDPRSGAFLGVIGHPAHGPNWVGPHEPMWTLQFEKRVVDSLPELPDSLSD
jgi:hypothetical protein